MTLKKKALEVTVGKGENAGIQHFLLFPQCFLLYQRENSHFSNLHFVVCNCFQFGHIQTFVVWLRVNSTAQSGLLTTLYNKRFENILGKEENAGYQHFLLFPQCFMLFTNFCHLQMLSIRTSPRF